MYQFAQTRQSLYEAAKRAVAAIPYCKPYQLTVPIQVKKQFLVFGAEGTEPKLVTKEGVIEDPLRLLSF